MLEVLAVREDGTCAGSQVGRWGWGMNTDKTVTPLQAAAIALGEYVGFTDYDEHDEHVYTGEARAVVAAYLNAAQDGCPGHMYCGVLGGDLCSHTGASWLLAELTEGGGV